ncbi:hypothetical protein [Kineosporia succinea]|uniref:Uncharacterized protein n=1 Tax=Kineosporia succinea TaxID=84632 RepID=A0ABT9PDF1_9ACTN|nr:hypothetical protein [Kineosporia succinea]MDP9830736.1 hypothetical protein [Kineosporia succinea]
MGVSPVTDRHARSQFSQRDTVKDLSGFDEVLRSVATQAPGGDPFAPRALTGAEGDPLVGHLTPSDRAAFASLHGVTIDPGGDVLVPIDMDIDTVHAVLAAAGQLASDRAHGRVTDATPTLDHITAMVRHFREMIAQERPLFGENA